MKSYPILILCALCLLTSGCCGTRKRQVSALERENSQLDGLLWEMQFQLETLEDENAELKQRLESTTVEADEADSAPRRTPRTRTEPTEAEPFDPGEFRPPVIEFPSDAAPEGTVPDSLLPGGGGDLLQPPGQTRTRRNPTRISVTSHEEPALLEPTIGVVPTEEVSPESNLIEQIVLGPMIGTLHLDDQAGDDGLVIVLEPWDDSERMLAAAADVSVVLIDAAESAETARVAEWQFSAEETAKLFRDGDLPGLHLELPWPGDPPRHDQLHLFVRYTTSDGRRLETDSIVEIELGGRGRWVATDTPRVRPYEQDSVPVSEIPVAPQLIAASADSAPAEITTDSNDSPALTASVPRIRMSEPDSEPRPLSTPEAEPLPKPMPIATEAKPLPRIEPAPEPPARRRPTWSPDRPW
jgi:hypothetical protein